MAWRVLSHHLRLYTIFPNRFTNSNYIAPSSPNVNPNSNTTLNYILLKWLLFRRREKCGHHFAHPFLVFESNEISWLEYPGWIRVVQALPARPHQMEYRSWFWIWRPEVLRLFLPHKIASFHRRKLQSNIQIWDQRVCVCMVEFIAWCKTWRFWIWWR